MKNKAVIIGVLACVGSAVVGYLVPKMFENVEEGQAAVAQDNVETIVDQRLDQRLTLDDGRTIAKAIADIDRRSRATANTVCILAGKDPIDCQSIE